MRSDEHKAEAERLIAVARTKEGAKAHGRDGDPTDPVAATVLAGVHAALAAAPDDVIDAEVVDEEAEHLVREAREWGWIGDPSAGTAKELILRLANALEERAGNGSGVQITADAFDVDPGVVEIDRGSLLDLQRRLMESSPISAATVVDGALLTLRSWLS